MSKKEEQKVSPSISVSLHETDFDRIPVVQNNLFPEGIAYNPNTEQFLLSSLTQGSIYAADEDGSVSPFIQDDRLVSSLGIAIDEKRNRILVANSDVGVSSGSSPETTNQIAGLGIFDLSTGESIDYIDLGNLRPEQPHFANDLDVDNKGNIYVTDSLSPIIYKVDPQGNSSIFLEIEQFAGEGFNLNGIVVHPDGFLIVADFNDGLLYKVPLDNPENFTQIQTDQNLINADGLLLGDKDELVVVTNNSNGESSNSVFNLQSHDNWNSAQVVDELNLGDNTPTTATIRDGDIFVPDANLSAGEITDEFAILEVGSIDDQDRENQIKSIFRSNNSDELFADIEDLVCADNYNNILDASFGIVNNPLFGDLFLAHSSDDRLHLFGDNGEDTFLIGASRVDDSWIISGKIPDTASTITDFDLGCGCSWFRGYRF